jgi:hypothetical protein
MAFKAFRTSLHVQAVDIEPGNIMLGAYLGADVLDHVNEVKLFRSKINNNEDFHKTPSLPECLETLDLKVLHVRLPIRATSKSSEKLENNCQHPPQTILLQISNCPEHDCLNSGISLDFTFSKPALSFIMNVNFFRR